MTLEIELFMITDEQIPYYAFDRMYDFGDDNLPEFSAPGNPVWCAEFCKAHAWFWEKALQAEKGEERAAFMLEKASEWRRAGRLCLSSGECVVPTWWPF